MTSNPVALAITAIAVSLAAAVAGQVPAPTPPAKPTLEESPVKLLREDKPAGLELWETRLGPIWIPAPGHWVISHLEWEQVDRHVYELPEARVRPGDVVIDAGAHVGVFTRVALRARARLVVAVEPELANILAFRRNFAQELRRGTVLLITQGLWDKKDTLTLRLAESSNDAHSLVFRDQRTRSEQIAVDTLDALCETNRINRVDFIKMDIEGAETNALRGARRTLERWRPRLAISAYHVAGDPAEIASIVWKARPDYRISSTEVVRSPYGTIVPKVLFFY